MSDTGVRPASLLAHQPALDGVRGVAVAAVLAFHARPDWLPGGFLGVDVSFVLSGFLITTLLLAEHHGHGRLNLAAFWACRPVVDANRRLCPDARFTWQIHGVRVRTDGLHLTPDAVREFLAPDLLPSLSSAAAG